jgi:hypothetical protein
MNETVGIDFEALEAFRENVEVKFPNGSTVKLPLITMRDSGKANLYLRQFDLLRTKYTLEATRLTQIGAGAEEQTNVQNTKENLELLSKATDVAIDAVEHSKQLIDKTNELVDEVLTFIEPYVKDIKASDTEDFITFLRKSEPSYTASTLQCMLYGQAAFKQDEDADSDEEEDESKKKEMTT